MFGNMMGKLQEMKQRMDEIKARLDTITVDGTSPDGKVKVSVTGNRKLKSIHIHDDSLLADKEQLEDYLIIAMNQALEKAENAHETEMKSAASGMMPGLGGMFS